MHKVVAIKAHQREFIFEVIIDSLVRYSKNCGAGTLKGVLEVAKILSKMGANKMVILGLLARVQQEISPYSPESGFALDVSIIDLLDIPEISKDKDLCQQVEADFKATPKFDNRTQTELQRNTNLKHLRNAFNKFRMLEENDPRKKEFDEFCKQESMWLEQYATFKALSDDHGGDNGANNEWYNVTESGKLP